MSSEKREHPAALQELHEAAFWYDEREAGLGNDFLDAIDGAIKQIVEWPNSAPVLTNGTRTPTIRHLSVEVFPYRVVYFVTDRDIVIVAYAHERREPNYWHRRLG